MVLQDVAASAPDGAVGLEPAADAQLPQLLALVHALSLDLGQDVPAQSHTCWDPLTLVLNTPNGQAAYQAPITERRTRLYPKGFLL